MRFIEYATKLQNTHSFEEHTNIYQDRNQNMNKFTRIQIIQVMLSGHNEIKLEIDT